MRRRSVKRVKDMIRRKQVQRIVFERDPFCRARLTVWCAQKAIESSDVHEPGRRDGSDAWLDPDKCLGVCRECHDYLHDHPTLSETLGLLVRSGRPTKSVPRRLPNSPHDMRGMDISLPRIYPSAAQLINEMQAYLWRPTESDPTVGRDSSNCEGGGMLLEELLGDSE